MNDDQSFKIKQYNKKAAKTKNMTKTKDKNNMDIYDAKSDKIR